MAKGVELALTFAAAVALDIVALSAPVRQGYLASLRSWTTPAKRERDLWPLLGGTTTRRRTSVSVF